MEKVKTLWNILVGLMLGGVGILMIYGAIHELTDTSPVLLWVFGIFEIALGIFMLTNAKSGARADIEWGKLRQNKYISRRVVLFLVLLMIYMFGAIGVNIRASEAGRNMIRILWTEAAGFAAIVIAYILMIIQAFKERKTNKIQDQMFAQVKLHANEQWFTMVIDHTENKEDRSYLTGYVTGTVKKNDQVYFYLSDHSRYRGIINALIKKDIQVEQAENEECTLEIITGGEMRDLPFGVCTSYIPFPKGNAENVVSNPVLFALLNGLPEHSGQEGYINYIVNEILNAKLLLRIMPADTGRIPDKIYAYFFGNNGPFRVPVVVHDHMPDETLPVYTDWAALQRCFDYGDEEEQKYSRAIVASFEELQVYLKHPVENIVINPFGPKDFFLSAELIRAIQEALEESRKEE